MHKPGAKRHAQVLSPMREGRKTGEGEGGFERGALDVSDVRTVAYLLPGVKITSPNKVVWSRQAAMAGSQKRKRLRSLAGLVVGIQHHECRSRVVVSLVRVAPRPFDYDNMVAGFKPVRDGVSDAFALRDDHACFVWRYGQRRGKPKEYGVEIHILK
jgi:hypothetical protein